MQTFIKNYGLYLACVVVGFLLALLLDKCNKPATNKPVTQIIERPAPTIETIEVRDTVRFGVRELRIDTIRDTITNEILDVRLDTLLKVDTLRVVESWLTELSKYDTTVSFPAGDLSLKWQNYQNQSEELRVTYTPNNRSPLKVMMLAKAGIQSDFRSIYRPTIGVGLLFEKKGFIFGADYGYSGQHNINGVVGYRLR